MKHKTLAAAIVKASGAPDADQLSAIRAYTLRDFAADELVVREFALAHNAIDRDSEVFSGEILADFARTIPGKGVHIRHPGGWDGDSGPGEGKVFAARLDRMTHQAARDLLKEPDLVWPPDQLDAVLLMVSAYYVRTPENESFLRKLDAGIAGEVSIGFRGGERQRVETDDGLKLDVWRWQPPGQALEMSHVWLGAQPGARATKNHNPVKTPDKEFVMNEEEKKALQTQIDALKALAETNAKAAQVLIDLRKALGDDAGLLDTNAGADLVALVQAGKAHREALIDDIVTGERHAGITGDSDEDVKAARELYGSLPVAKLAAMAKRYTKSADAPAGQIEGSDPNTPAPGDGATKAVAGSPAANPIFSA